MNEMFYIFQVPGLESLRVVLAGPHFARYSRQNKKKRDGKESKNKNKKILIKCRILNSI